MRHKKRRLGQTIQIPVNPIIDRLVEQIKYEVPTEVVHSNYEDGAHTEIRHGIHLRKERIAIGIPLDELMFTHFFTNFCYLSIMPWDSMITSVSTFVTGARNSIHDTFLEKSKATHLFMLDSDVLPPPDAIDRLLAHNLPMVGGWYRKKERFRVKNENGEEVVLQRPVVYDYDKFDETKGKHVYRERMEPGTGLEKVGGMGAGCWMIRRDVCEKVGKSPYALELGGEDLSFGKKVQEAGFDIYCDWTLACAHVGTLWV